MLASELKVGDTYYLKSKPDSIRRVVKLSATQVQYEVVGNEGKYAWAPHCALNKNRTPVQVVLVSSVVA